MATIHHNVVKSAASKGVILTYSDEDGVTAHRPEPNRRVTLTFESIDPEGDDGELTGPQITDRARDAWNALDEILAWEAEHPGFRIETEDGDFVGSRDDEEVARDPDLTDLFETLLEESDEQEEDDEGESEGGSVVPAKYKAEYKERGDPNHCGDWLALTLAALIRVKNEKGKEVTDIDRLETIANANGVDNGRYGKLGIATNGWQGRYRMTVRNMLTPLVAAKGHLFVPEGCGANADTELTAPREWCLSHSPKPKQAAEKPAPKAAAKARGKKASGEAGLKAANEAIKNSRKKVPA